MTKRDIWNEVARRADTPKSPISAAVVYRVLSVHEKVEGEIYRLGAKALGKKKPRKKR